MGILDENDQIRQLALIFEYVYRDIRPARFSGTTDAVLTCRLGEASCNGKSRLMVALCRHVGIPSRLVGGLILQGREKRTTHQWVEVYVNGSWVPFCPLNGHYALKPANYCVFYRGDHAFFKRSADIGLDYTFILRRRLVPKEEDFGGHHQFDIVNVWNTFSRAGIPLHVLSVVLVIPIGALVTIIFRNVIGVQAYGTFLPALIGYAFLSTGLVWRIAIFAGIIIGGSLINWGLSYLRLLHTPRLTVIMVFTVIVLMSLGMYGVNSGTMQLTQAFSFPLAILSITTERFFTIAQERGIVKSFTILGWTLLVVVFCYMVMSSLFLQMVVVVLPEVYLLIIASALYFGHWTGLRIWELYRFRSLMGNPPKGMAHHA